MVSGRSFMTCKIIGFVPATLPSSDNIMKYKRKPGQIYKNNDRIQTSGNTPPQDVVYCEILPKLPVKSLLRFKSVSKEWQDFIANNAFLKKAHARYAATVKNNSAIVIVHKYFFPRVWRRENSDGPKFLMVSGETVEETQIPYLLTKLRSLNHQEVNNIGLIGSCTGLVLLSTPYVLWNPATREFRVLPYPELQRHKRFEVLALGFNDDSDDHKVVRVNDVIVMRSLVHAWYLNIHVFNKNGHSWKKLEPVHGFCLYDMYHRGVSINGNLYFLARKDTTYTPVLMSFTYRNDKLQHVIKMPKNDHLELVRWKEDSLAAVAPRRDDVYNDVYDGVFDLWVLTKKGVDKFYCSKYYVFNNRVCSVWSDQFLLVQRPSRQTQKLVLRGSRTDREDVNRCVVLAELNDPSWTFGNAVDYVPTLVSVFPNT